MESKDFRYRLNNHKVPMNEASWEKMQMLLDADKLPEKKNKRRYFFWWFFSGLLLVGIVLSSLYLSSSKNVLNVSKDKTITENNSYTEKLSKDTKVQNGLLEKPQPTVISDLQIGSKNEDQETISNNSKADKSNFSKASANEIAQNSNVFDPASEDLLKKSANEENTKQSTLPQMAGGQNHSIQNTEESIKTENEGFSEIDKRGDNTVSPQDESGQVDTGEQTIVPGDDSLNDAPIGKSNMMPLEKLISNKEIQYLFAKRAINEDMVVVNPSLSKWFYFAQMGYVEINGNPGLIFGAGLRYQFDRILHLESSLSYAYGNETGVLNGEPRTEEREIDLGLIVHFNLVSTEKSRFAFEVGYGLTKYWGQRIIRSEPVTIDVRNSLGTHYQGGLSYTYKVNRNSQLSLKLGVVAYDDSLIYLALKYYKRI